MSDEKQAGTRMEGWARIAGRVITGAYWIAGAALLAWGAMLRFHLPQVPMIDPDIEGYLGPAISALAGKGFIHLMSRSFPYPWFVYLVLRVSGDFRAIPVVQHALGVAAGGVILLAWNAAVRLVPEGGIPRAVSRCFGLAPAYVFLGSATAIAFEQEIRPEGVFPFLTILTIWVSFLFLDARFVRKRPSYVWLGGLNVFLAVLDYFTKPSFGFEMLFCALPVWIALVLPGTPARERWRMAAMAIVPALVLLVLPEHLLKEKDPWSKIFLPETLVSAHSILIEQQMTEDLAGNGPLPFPRSEVQAAHDFLGREIQTAIKRDPPQAWGAPEYKYDYNILEYLQYAPTSFCVTFPGEMHFTPAEMGHFCMTYYLRTLRHHPRWIAAKVSKQMALFYVEKNPVYWMGRSMGVSDIYANTAGLMGFAQALGPWEPAVGRYVTESDQLAGEDVQIPQERRFVEWLRFFAGHYLDLLAVAILSPVLLIFRPLRAHFAWLVAAIWLSYSYNTFNSLTTAVVHTLELTRYIRIQLIYTVFSQCLSIYLLFEILGLGVRALARRMGLAKERERPAATVAAG